MPTGSSKYREAEESLPKELRPTYKNLVEQYEYMTTLYYGRGYVAYKVLAELVLAGWRLSGEPSARSRI